MAEKFVELQKRAVKMGIPFEADKITEEELLDLVEEKEEAEEEERRIKNDEDKKALDARNKSKLILKNTSGKDVDEKLYFFKNVPTKEMIEKGFKDVTYAPEYFNRICGLPVDREPLLEAFDRIFNPRDGFLFYKVLDRELYIIIVPLKFAATIGKHNDSMGGAFQRHAISFINEGSVNIETLKAKLKRIAKNVTINREQ